MSESMTRLEIEARSTKLDEFMRTKNVPKKMRTDLGEQLSNYFEKKSALDEKAVISCLPPKHQKDLVMAIYRPYLVDCPLMQGLEKGVVARLCLVMRPYLAMAGDPVVLEGEVGEEMYLITRGAVKLESKMYPAYNARMWEDGAFFAELPVLGCGGIDSKHSGGKVRRVLHVYTARALIDSHCTYITRTDLNELDKKRPILKQTMRKFAVQRAVRFGIDMKFAESIESTKLAEKQQRKQRDAFLNSAGMADMKDGAPMEMAKLVEETRELLSRAKLDAKAQLETEIDDQVYESVRGFLKMEANLGRLAEMSQMLTLASPVKPVVSELQMETPPKARRDSIGTRGRR